MRKKITALFTIAMMLAFTGCSSATATTETTQATTEAQETDSISAEQTTEAMEPLNETITFWYCYTDKIQENNIALTEEFNETVGKELGIVVNAEYQGDYATMSQKLKASYVAGTAPAVTVMDTSMIEPYVESGVIESLDPYIERDEEEVQMDDFQAAFLTDSTFNDNIYSLPYLRSTPILYLNTTLIEEAGLDPSGPSDWEELAEYAEQIKEKTGKYGMTIFAYPWVFQAFMLGQGSSIYNEDTTATNINSEESKAILESIIEMRDNGSVKVIASSQADNLMADITSQNSAMWFYSTGGLTTFMALGEANGFDVTTAYIPSGTVEAVNTGGANLMMISNLTENQKEAAWQFIKWMTAKDQTVTASITTGYIPTRISASSDSRLLDLYEEVPEFKTAVDQLAIAGGRTPSAFEADAVITSALDEILVNDADIDTTLSELEIKVNEILNQ